MAALRRHPTDRFLFSDVPPSVPEHVPLNPSLKSVLNIQKMVRRQLLHAFPTETNVVAPPNSLAPLHLTLTAAYVPFDGDLPSSDFIDAALQTGFVNDLLNCFRLATRVDPSKYSAHLSRLLGLLHVYVTSSDLLAARLAENHLTIPLLFTPMPSRQTTDIIIPLIEEIIHSARPTIHFEIASLESFSIIINALSPFQLGAMCRVLSLFLDDRESVYVCNSSDSAHSTSYHHNTSSTDWRRIEKPHEVRKSRRSYLDPRGKLVRDRNHAAVLAVPNLLEKLVKIISIPPPCAKDIFNIDETLRRGIDYLVPNDPNANPNINDPAAPAADVPNIPNNNPNPDASQRHVEFIFILLRVRVLLLVYKRLVGSQLGEDILTQADTWPMLNLRIEEAKQRWAETGSAVQILKCRSNSASNSNQHTTAEPQNLDDARDTLESLRQQLNHLEIDPSESLQTAEQESVLAAAQEALAEATQLAASFAAVANEAEVFAQQLMAAANTAVEDAVAILADAEVAAGAADEANDGNQNEPEGASASVEQVPDSTANPDVGFGILNTAEGSVSGRTEPSHNPQNARTQSSPSQGVIFRHAPAEQVSESASGGQNTAATDASISEPEGGGDGNVDEENIQDSNGNGSIEIEVPPHDVIHVEGNGEDNADEGANIPENGPANEQESLQKEMDELLQDNLLWMTSNMMLTHVMEALSVLYSLLSGKRRTEVRERLIQLGIVEIVCRMLDSFEWKDAQAETRTEDTLKVHLLRVVHYLCDGIEDNVLSNVNKTGRLLLFSKGEAEIIQSIEDRTWQEKYVVLPVGMGVEKAALRLITERDKREFSKSAQESDNMKDAIMLHFCPIHGGCRICNITHVRRNSGTNEETEEKYKPLLHVERGLMMRIVEILMKTLSSDEINIGRRYLLSGCVETFQRCASMAEKTFVGRLGLVEHLVRQICESFKLLSHKNQFRQTSFDLLGHLVKWNRDLFGVMNELLTGEHAVFSQLLEVVSERLIDSNVFVRSIALSLERFRAEDAFRLSDEPYCFEDCVLWAFLVKWKARIIFDLMRSVHVDDVNYENISSVNTTLIMFVLYGGKTEHELDLLLRQVGDIMVSVMEENESESATEVNLTGLSECRIAHGNMVRMTDAIQNFKSVVHFWMEYYTYQASDITSLELSTDLTFDSFVSMARMLSRRLDYLDKTVKERLEGY